MMGSKIYTKWKEEFTERIKSKTKNRKQVFTLKDAIDKSANHLTDFDKVMIEYHQFLSSDPLSKNDFFKYIDSYRRGKKLNDDYFKHDLDKLKEYYKKIDENPDYHFCSRKQWEDYVLFMLLKFNGYYNGQEMDDEFNVTHRDNREYNPLTNIPSVLRGVLPDSLKLVEYDISRANPTFIDMEISYNRDKDIYSRIDKKTFNTLINSHNGNASIENVKKKLKPVYGDKVDRVITRERFHTKGRMFKDLVCYEKKYINRFVEENNIDRYVRLHDAVYVSADCKIDRLLFDDKVEFKQTAVAPPRVGKYKKSFYELTETKKGKAVITSPAWYADFFEQENFIRVSIPGDDRIVVFKDTNNVATEYNYKSEMPSFLMSHINEVSEDEELVRNKIAKDKDRVIEQGLHLLESKPLYYYRDMANTFGLPFKNGFFQLTKGDTEPKRIDYRDVDGFFPKHSTQQRNFTFKYEPGLSEIERFICMISVGKDPLWETLTDEEKQIRDKWFCMIGYMVHTYKKPSFSPGVILSDDGADNISRNGGRGKTIIAKILKEILNTMIKGGNEFDASYRHNFADLDESIKIYVLDDVPASFKYNDLYTNIVSDISIQPKGKKARTIPFKRAPKFLITTNWAVRYDENATSTNRRFIEFKLTDYFNLNNTPEDVFGHTLFEDWDEREWNRFNNFIFSCVALYFEEGLQQIKYDKDRDNYQAYFSNQVKEKEFERIFHIMKDKGSFTVGDFLTQYNSYDNPLKHEKLFHTNNTKSHIEAYLKHHSIDYNYRKSERKFYLNGQKNKSDDNLDKLADGLGF